MKILADESVDFGIVKNLRNNGLNVISVLEDNPGITDASVLEKAVKNDLLLLTEDKDFGELTYRLRLPHAGILLIRLTDVPRQKRIEMVFEILQKHAEKLSNNFSVLTSKNLRIRTNPSRNIPDL